MTIAPLVFPKKYYGDDPPAATASPLSYAHLGELELANKRAKKIRRAVRIAQTDAWVCGIFAALTLVSGIFSLTALILGLGLAFCTFNSFRGAKRLKHFDPAAPRLLALNQLLLAACLIAYAAYSLYAASRGSSELAAAAASNGPEVARALEGFHIDRLVWIISLALYGGLIAGTIVAQGLTAIYYITRRKHLALYLAQTPDWILAVQKTQLGG